MHTPQVAYTGTAMMGGGAVVGAVYTGDAGQWTCLDMCVDRINDACRLLLYYC